MGCGSSKSLEERNKLFSNKKQRPKRKSGKKVTYKGVTVLGNVMEMIPPTVSRDEIREMVNNSLESGIKSNKKLSPTQIEGIIDMLMVAVSDNDNKSIDDKRLDDVKAIIGFYPVNKENIKNLFYKGQKPSETEIEDMINKLSGDNEEANILVIELIWAINININVFIYYTKL